MEKKQKSRTFLSYVWEIAEIAIYTVVLVGIIAFLTYLISPETFRNSGEYILIGGIILYVILLLSIDYPTEDEPEAEAEVEEAKVVDVEAEVIDEIGQPEDIKEGPKI